MTLLNIDHDLPEVKKATHKVRIMEPCREDTASSGVCSVLTRSASGSTDNESLDCDNELNDIDSVYDINGTFSNVNEEEDLLR